MGRPLYVRKMAEELVPKLGVIILYDRPSSLLITVHRDRFEAHKVHRMGVFCQPDNDRKPNILLPAISTWALFEKKFEVDLYKIPLKKLSEMAVEWLMEIREKGKNGLF